MNHLKRITYFLRHLFVYVLVVLGLLAALRLFLIAESRGCSPVTVCRLLTTVASPVAEHGLQGARVSVVATGGFRSCRSWASSTQVL